MTTPPRDRPVPFEKLDGAGNDFVLLRSPVPVPDREQVRQLLDRHRGIGGDGLLHLTPSPGLSSGTDALSPLDAVVRYWNSDGGFAEFCGNGARCIASVLLEGRPDDSVVRFRLSDVLVSARRVSRREGKGHGHGGGGGHDQGEGKGFGEGHDEGEGEGHGKDEGEGEGKGHDEGNGKGHGKGFGEGENDFAVAHPMPRALTCPPEVLALTAGLRLLHPPAAYDSGVPHLLLEVEDVGAFDLARWGQVLRRHPAWGEAGTNVDVVHADPTRGLVRVRTWERGVEGETLACGSGLLAVGAWMQSRRMSDAPLLLVSASGARFRVWPEDGALWLSGPARRVFRGEFY